MPWRFLEILAALRRIAPDLVCTHTAKAGLLGRVAGAALRISHHLHAARVGHRRSHLLGQGRIFRHLERLAGNSLPGLSMYANTSAI